MSDEEVIKLYHGISESMQIAIIEIMKVTQQKDGVKEHGAQIIQRSDGDSIDNRVRNNNNAVPGNILSGNADKHN